MRLPGIGMLTLDQDCWHVLYDGCGHRQLLAREGLKTHERAASNVRRYYAKCLSCLLAKRMLRSALAVRPHQDMTGIDPIADAAVDHLPARGEDAA